MSRRHILSGVFSRQDHLPTSENLGKQWRRWLKTLRWEVVLYESQLQITD